MEDKCYYCHEVKEQGWTYEGCFYVASTNYPDECHKSSCPNFLSARKASEIIKKSTAGMVSIDTVVRWIRAARDDVAFTIRKDELDSYQKIMKAIAYYREGNKKHESKVVAELKEYFKFWLEDHMKGE